ncbi:hypothetical protein [Chroogloeocystis siderophila]|jgi:hypothetical protein|nr:hypothetical protein [Chroogloeocystis siderophila]
MRGFLRKLLKWFKALLRKLLRSDAHKPQHNLLTKKPLETKLEKPIFASSSFSVKVESPSEQANTQPSPCAETETQKPLNYPPMPQRELLIDRPFEFKSERASYGSSPAVQGEEVLTNVTPQLSTSRNETQHIEKFNRKRLYIGCRTEELERIADSEWNNPHILSELHYELQFRTRKKARTLLLRISERLTALKGTKTLVQSTTTATTKIESQELSGDIFKYQEGLLKLYGYKVGVNGLPENQRRQILNQIFLYPLRSIDNVSYLNEWGQPGTAKRLKKLAESIAAFTRNAKRHNTGAYNKAIQEWEADLAYLKRTYYNERFDFHWPQTGISRL